MRRASNPCYCRNPRGLFAFALAALLCGSICSMSYAQAQAAENPLETLAKKLADRLVAKMQKRVTVLDFTDIQNRPNELGRYLALQLANELVNLPDIAVVDRANLATIMAEHKLTAEGLLKPEDAKKLGQFAGVDAILIGNVSSMGESVEIMVRAISTETSEIVASGKATIPATKDSTRMLGLSVEGGSAGSPGAGGATATEGAAIATREIGPITAVLRNVVEQSKQSEKGVAVPMIRCTFDLENRNLQRFVAVAANQVLRNRFGILLNAGYRGGLADSNRVPWTLIDQKGISAVACFDITPTIGADDFRQSNFGGIVDYIRTANKWDGRKLDSSKGNKGRLWSGSFASIPPGKNIRLTVDFIREDMFDRWGALVGRDTDSSAHYPDQFQFDMELVLGTYAEGEDPAKAKDLMLRNLTIDRVVLGDKPAAP